MPHACIVGIDIGATKTTVVIGDASGRVTDRTERATLADRPFDETWPALRAQIAGAIDAAHAQRHPPVALSVAIGGPLIPAEGRLLGPPNLPGWRDVNLRDRLVAAFPALPVYIEHDAKAGALAEYRFGVGRQRPTLRDMIFLTFGTGLGAGIIAGGRLIRGTSEMAGEVWSLQVRPPTNSRVSDVGDWESAASGRGLQRLAARMYSSRWSESTPTRELVAAALTNDPDAANVVHECGRWLGAGLAVLATALNPEVIVLGSLAVALGNRVLDPAREVLAERTAVATRASLEVMPAALGAHLGDVQSLMAAIEAGPGGAALEANARPPS